MRLNSVHKRLRRFVAWNKTILKCQQGSSFVCEVEFSSQNATESSREKRLWISTQQKSQQNGELKSECVHFIKTCQVLAGKKRHFKLHVMCCVSFPQGDSGDWLYHSLLVIAIHWDNKSILAFFSCQSKQNLLPIQKKNSESDQMIGNDVVWCQSEWFCKLFICCNICSNIYSAIDVYLNKVHYVVCLNLYLQVGKS